MIVFVQTPDGEFYYDGIHLYECLITSCEQNTPSDDGMRQGRGFCTERVKGAIVPDDAAGSFSWDLILRTWQEEQAATTPDNTLVTIAGVTNTLGVWLQGETIPHAPSQEDEEIMQKHGLYCSPCFYRRGHFSVSKKRW